MEELHRPFTAFHMLQSLNETCDKEELPVPAPLFSVTAKVDKEKVPLPEAHDPATGHGRWLYEAWGLIGEFSSQRWLRCCVMH